MGVKKARMLETAREDMKTARHMKAQVQTEVGTMVSYLSVASTAHFFSHSIQVPSGSPQYRRIGEVLQAQSSR